MFTSANDWFPTYNESSSSMPFIDQWGASSTGAYGDISSPSFLETPSYTGNQFDVGSWDWSW